MEEEFIFQIERKRAVDLEIENRGKRGLKLPKIPRNIKPLLSALGAEEKQIRETATLVIPHQTLSVVKKDEDDNRILECGVEGKAQYIISGDKRHLLSPKQYQGIKILSPANFLKEPL